MRDSPLVVVAVRPAALALGVTRTPRVTLPISRTIFAYNTFGPPLHPTRRHPYRAVGGLQRGLSIFNGGQRKTVRGRRAEWNEGSCL